MRYLLLFFFLSENLPLFHWLLVISGMQQGVVVINCLLENPNLLHTTGTIGSILDSRFMLSYVSSSISIFDAVSLTVSKGGIWLVEEWMMCISIID